MTAADVQKRYSDTIEAAIAKAKASGAREAVEASDGAEAYALAVLAGLRCVFATLKSP
jgi:hypothetical protein